MKLKSVSVKNLFGHLTFEVPFKLDDRITIIHAPNGFGKTTILEMVNALLEKRFAILLKYEYDLFTVTFENTDRLEIRQAFDRTPISEKETRRPRSRRPSSLFHDLRSAPDENVSFGIEIKLLIKGEKSTKHNLDVTELFEPDEAAIDVLRHEHGIARITPGMFRNIRTGDRIRIKEMIEQYPEYCGRVNTDLPYEIDTLLDAIPPLLIRTRRLDPEIRIVDESFRARPSATRLSSITARSAEMQEAIEQALNEYASVSSSLDETFPETLIAAFTRGISRPRAADLRQRISDLELSKLGLYLNGILEEPKPRTYDTSFRKKSVLTCLDIYLDHQKRKLGVFDQLSKKISLMTNLVNARLTNKSFSVQRNHGYIVHDNKGGLIPLDRLSSGEQHQIILFHQLLFGLQEDSLVLIDEPEISLHVVWQEMFLSDLVKIAELVDASFVISTHSPMIIGDRWDLTVEIKNLE
jgi:ABC-type lipoprotein export system ATPase subunit